MSAGFCSVVAWFDHAFRNTCSWAVFSHNLTINRHGSIQINKNQTGTIGNVSSRAFSKDSSHNIDRIIRYHIYSQHLLCVPSDIHDDLSLNYNLNHHSDNRSDIGDDRGYYRRRDFHRRGIAFFIARLEAHYQRLHIEVFERLSKSKLTTITLTSDGSIGPSPNVSIFDSLRYQVEMPIDSFNWNNAKEHMKHDNPITSKDIDELRNDIAEHNEDVNSAEAEIEDIIEDKFTNEKIKRAEKPEYGYYYKDMLSFLTVIWRNVLLNVGGQELKSYLSEFDLEKVGKLENEGDILKWLGSELGRGIEKDRKNMEDMFKSLAKDETIIATLIDLESRKPEFEKRTNAIAKMAMVISKVINANAYWTKASCCPTPLRLLWHYFRGK